MEYRRTIRGLTLATSRKFRANGRRHDSTQEFADNRISTSKYNLITFLPKNLFEQFRRLANSYFLILVCLQFIPQVTSLTPGTSIAPLSVVLLITAIKDAVDDIRRHRSDKQINNREVNILAGHDLIRKKWQEVQVGDIIQVENNEFIPADMVLLSTSKPNGLCFIETAELDGEINLKLRRALHETCSLKDHIDGLASFNGEIECEAPNNRLERFQGNLIWNEKVLALKNENILLRGAKLKNTQWVFGIVCYAGSDTKIMKNSGIAIFKRTKIDHLLNRFIISIFLLLLIMCTIMTISNGLWESSIGYHFRIYVPWETYISTERRIGALERSLLTFFSYAIILHTVIPISLYVSIEIIRLILSKWIDWDNRMYYEPNNVQAQARTTTLNEELGQIQYIFSDKTGTLTQNMMTFKKCSIRGQLYGYADDEIESSDMRSVDFQEKYGTFQWYDEKLLDAIERNDRNVHRFFTLLSVCHTVMSEEKDGEIVYQAQSPDDDALVSASRAFGFMFLDRTQNSITVRFGDREETYDLLHILDFDNDRKRISVIVKQHGRIFLYCKGADSKIEERLDPSERDLMAITNDHLHQFATNGLRTLCLAYKELRESDYQIWAKKLHAATTSMDRRDEKVSKAYEEIEKNFKLLGATAIEDKLQDGVPECIERLTSAGIKIWVLTGDKLETARNIGLSCRLLTDAMVLYNIEEETEDAVGEKLQRVRNDMIHKIEQLFNVQIEDKTKRLNWKDWSIDVMNFDQHRKSTQQTERDEEAFQGFGLLITGSALLFALNENLQMKFLEISTMCQAVICCRVTPLQKAQVVDLVMKNEDKITLAIGDGANDVSMIQKAHIGVGISGQEGRQAVLASDYSLGQFRFLERLLLVHGRWSYMRISKFLRYFFYKNVAFTLCHFWFGIFSGFTAQTLFDPFFIATYNIFFTSLPVLVLGIFDQDISAEHSLSKPYLYKFGQNDELFNKRIFAESIFHGIITSCVIFFVPYLSVIDTARSNGITFNDVQSFGFTVATILIIVVNVENALEVFSWTSFYHFVFWGTIVAHFLFHFVLYSTIIQRIYQKARYPYVGVAQVVLSTGHFWFALILTCVILLLPIFFREFFRIRFMPTEIDRARLNQKFRVDEKIAFFTDIKKHLRQVRRAPRSTYAFSQEAGWGELITSGIMQSELRSSVVVVRQII
ncbi:unnamed protein product [Adineta ricciae]|uniref:Phospholipid-transporting ATPase n=1 Tax=Adineta ricciae TaxID=249248 RepID=A0A813WQV5_ADIRI|nr:unnamed protein product [Adineta ricciae]